MPGWNDLFISQHGVRYIVLQNRWCDNLFSYKDDKHRQYYLIGKSMVEIWSRRSSVSSPSETGINWKRIEAVCISWWRCRLRTPALQKFLFHYNLERIRLLQYHAENILSLKQIFIRLLISHRVTEIKMLVVDAFYWGISFRSCSCDLKHTFQ